MVDNNKTQEIIDLSSEVPKADPKYTPTIEPWHPERAKMRLAYLVLGGIFGIFILGIACQILAKLNLLDPTVGSFIFELWRTGLLPIITLILGYYFSKE